MPYTPRIPTASTTVAGVSELATQAEAEAASSAGVVLTPLQFSQAIAYRNFLARRTSDLGRNTTTAFADDPVLQIVLPVAGTYELEFNTAFECNAAGGAKVELNFTGTVSNNGFLVMNYGNNVAAVNGYYLTSALNGTLGNTSASPILRGRGHFTPSSAGTLSLRWAQNVSNGADSTIKSGSFLIAKRM